MKDIDGVDLNDKIKVIKQAIRSIKCLVISKGTVTSDEIIKEFEEEIKYLTTIQQVKIPAANLTISNQMIPDLEKLYPCVDRIDKTKNGFSFFNFKMKKNNNKK